MLGIIEAKLGRIGEAFDHFMQCLELGVSEFGKNHQIVCQVFWQIGNSYAK